MSPYSGVAPEFSHIEDPLQYLPRGVISEVRRGREIYSEEYPASGIYFLSSGRAAISQAASGEARVVVEICSPEQFLGLTALIYGDRYAERATALDNCMVMFWATEVVERQIERQPRLGLALVQAAVQRTSRFIERLASMATDSTTDRLARLLLMLGNDTGRTSNDGWLEVPAVTHQVLADCIGTSREVVTAAMNKLRREAYLTYSRRLITISEAALRDRLAQQRQTAPPAA